MKRHTSISATLSDTHSTDDSGSLIDEPAPILIREASNTVVVQSKNTCVLHSVSRTVARYIKLQFPDIFPAGETEKLSDLYNMKDLDYKRDFSNKRKTRKGRSRR
jgi:hypothetical protein